ncbi:MAG: hypothetical protein L3J74_17135 [Bacteroidales bacterium]|nr:hypothetical protein [Bacteroidales bacterium]
MVKRIKIGIPFSYNENWIGGTYYIINLIRATNLLEDKIKPEIIIFHTKNENLSLLKNLNYPYIKFNEYKTWRNTNRLQRGINKISRIIIKKNIFDFRPTNRTIDVLFPANFSSYFELIPFKQKLFWIPDFQEHFLPQFFTNEEIIGRKNYQKKLVALKANIVFSSNNALNDFNEIY